MNARRVEDHRHPPVDRLVHPADQLGLVVGLPDIDAQPELPPGRRARAGQVVQRRRAVHLGLAGAEPGRFGPFSTSTVRIALRTTSAYARASRSSGGSARMAGPAPARRAPPGAAAPRGTSCPPPSPRAAAARRRAGSRVGSPTAARIAPCRAAVASSSRPASRATAAANIMPIATAVAVPDPVALRPLDRVAERVPVVEHLPRPGLAQVGGHHPGLHPDRALDQLALVRAARPRGGCRVRLDQVEDHRIGDEPGLDHLGQPADVLGARAAEAEHGQVGQHPGRRVERADQVLALRGC